MDDLAVQNPLSHIAEVETGVSVGFSIPGRVSVSGRNSTSGSIFVPRPSRACDLVTMVEAGPAPGRVTTGVGSVSRGAGTKPKSPDRSLRPTLRSQLDSMSITGKFTKRLLSDLGKFCETTEVRN